jgi:replication factor C subunit 2/4
VIKNQQKMMQLMRPASDSETPWPEKYRPKTLDDMAQTENLMKLFKKSIETGDMTHYLFYGAPGTGKTSAIHAISRKIFGKFYSERVIEFNASDDRGINAVREKITNEAKKHVSEVVDDDGRPIPAYKIIILDEADSMTDEAQDALRVIIEQYSRVTRFCFICNYITKITGAIKSRCSLVFFKRVEPHLMKERLKIIATKESMVLTDEIGDMIVNVSNGDMRKAIMILQNLRYTEEYRKFLITPLDKMTDAQLKIVPSAFVMGEIVSTEITEDDVYSLAATISPSGANKIIGKLLKCERISEITALTKEIIGTGIPIDNIMLQLNQTILEDETISDIVKGTIFEYSNKIFTRIKCGASEYIQMLDYLTSIHHYIKT